MSAPISILKPIRTKKDAEAIAGPLGEPTKMPGYSYGLSAERCITGAALAKIPGTVCHGCYALKGNYQYRGVRACHDRRLAGLAHPQWVDAMVFLIAQTGTQYFRWHDSGDLQGVWHLEQICEVARRLPRVKFWLPTREKGIVREHARMGFNVPANLVVRVSGAMVDGPAPLGFATTSTVVSKEQTCPAPRQGNFCGLCRACWDPGVKNVSYAKH